MNKETWQLIKDKYPISSYLSDKGIEYHRKGRNLVLKCILPGHNDSKPSFVVYDDARYTCFACTADPQNRDLAQGDIFDLASILESKPRTEVLFMLAAKAGVEMDAAESAAMRRRFEDTERRKETANGFAMQLANSRPWMRHLQEKRGLDIRTITYFNLGVDPASQCIAIPLRDQYSRLLGFTLHHPKAEAKYRNPEESELYTKGKFLFNADSIKAALAEKNVLYLVEGYMDAMSMWQHGYRATLAYCGPTLTTSQAALLKTLINADTQIVIIPDADVTGSRAVRTTFETIRHVVRNAVHVCFLTGKDADNNDFVAKDANDWFALHRQTEIPHKDVVSYFEYIVQYYRTLYPDEFVQAERIKEALKPAHEFERTKLIKKLAGMWDFTEQQAASFLNAQTSVAEVEWKDVRYRNEEYLQYVQNLDENRMSVGFKEIDDAIRGLNPGEICALMGRANTCKTLMCTDAQTNMVVLGKGVPTVFFSLEMPSVSIQERMITQFMRVRAEGGESPSKFVEDQARTRTPEMLAWIDKINIAHQNIIVVDTPGLTIKDMERLLNDIEANYFGEPVRMIVVDHLQIIRSEGQTDYARTTNAAKDLREFTRRRKLGTIVLVQTSRKGGSGGEPLSMDDARDSGVIEEVMDFILGIWRPELKILQEMEKVRSAPATPERRFLKDDSGKVMKGSDGRARSETEVEAIERVRSEKASQVRMFSQMLYAEKGTVMCQVLKSRREGRNALFVYKIVGLNLEFVRKGDQDLGAMPEGGPAGQSSGIEPDGLDAAGA